MRVTITGATGLIGSKLIAALRDRGDEITVLTRNPERASAKLEVAALGWDLSSEPAPAKALQGRDAVIHLAGENIAQRWSEHAKREIRDSRLHGTANLIEGLRALEGDARPPVLVSSSAVGYYGPHGEEPLDEDTPAGHDFLAKVCDEWERAAERASGLGMRVVQIRTGVVLDSSGGALAKMLPPFRLGLGGPVAGGRQYISWVHPEDLAGLMLAAADSDDWSGPVNATAPKPVTNGQFAKILGSVLHRPALMPVPGFALRALYGEMAQVVTSGARVLPAKALVLGYRFRYSELADALSDALA